MTLRSFLFLALTAAPALGCGSSSSSPAAQTRNGYIEAVADDACDHYGDTSGGCPGYGTASNQKYQTREDCIADFQNTATKLWPADRCTDETMTESGFEGCDSRAKTYACSQGGQNILDAISALNECSADSVCAGSP